jgi:transposase
MVLSSMKVKNKLLRKPKGKASVKANSKTSCGKTNTFRNKVKKKPSADKAPRMTTDEKRLAREMHFDRGMTQTEVSSALGRHLSCINRLLAQKKAPKAMARPRALTKDQVDKIEKVLNNLIDEAEGTYEVTMDMIMKRSRTKASARTVARRLHERGYWFRDLRCKPILTPEDVKERYAFAGEYKGKPASWWLKHIHIHADNHMFPVATKAKGRKLLSVRRVRGAYRKKGKSLRPGLVKPSRKFKVNTGAKGILKTGAVGGGKVLVFHTIVGRWGGESAASMYKDVMAKALRSRYPKAKSFVLLEDNDPSGNLSTKGIESKRAAKIKVFQIPKRSPELNVLDYAIWSEIEKRMRAQERKFPDSKKESRPDFEKRLDRTAQNLEKDYIDRCIKSMKRRCELLYKAKGGLFEEKARSRRPK